MSLDHRISALTPEQRALFETLRRKQRQAARASKPPAIPRVTGATAEGDWPLSLDQERYWFMEQLFPGGAGLNITAATRLRGAVSPAFVAAALTAIVRRHAAWRTVFPAVDGRPVQRVLAPRRQELPVIDLGGLPAARREREALRLVGEDSAAPFDLERGPLVRSRLVRLSGEDHVCLLTVHHLVTDFLSFHIAWGELAALYDALAAGRRPALPEPPVQYPDFALWQRGWLQGEVLAELATWWRERLEGYPRTLDLPADRPRPAELSLRGGRLPFTVDGKLADALRALARQEGATLFMAVLALTAALLHRDSGAERMVLGANNANRNRPEIEGVLGCFLTQVPFPLDLGGAPTFRELLARARQSALGSYAHQDLPFGQLIQAIALERDPSRPPLVQTLVQVLDGQSAAAASFGGATFEAVDAWDGRARYELMLTLFEVAGGGLDGALEYDADLFDAATTARRVERLVLLAAAVTADPDLRLPALPVLPAAARHQVLVEWNDTARPAPGWTAPERFAAQAALRPDALAVTAGGETLTYGELDRRSATLARRLRALGVGRESRVALLLDRTVDVPVAMLGVWRAGGAYVPLDLDAPAARLAGLLADAEPAVVIHRGGPPVALAATPSLDLAVPEEAVESDAALPEIRPGDLAYLLYTSGTTGRPKAVMVEHGSLAAFLAAFLDHVSLRPGDRVAGLTRYTFDPSLLDVVAPLAAGGDVEILGGDEILDPESVLDALARAAVAFAVPSLLRRAIAGARARGPEPFAGLRVLWAGGEAVTPELQADLLAAFPATGIDAAYGPTEATIVSTTHRVSRRRPPERVLIGRPLPGVEARVVDPRGELVPLGIPGELWIGGPVVARGYFRREELTAERFVNLAAAAGRRFYRTGDLVRRVPAEGGALEFLGRLDFQVKVRGFRIEPGEIEAALLAHPEVTDAVVVARPGAGGEAQLVAYVVGTDEDGELRAFLRARLPEHMVPALFVPLAALPLGANGKVDRRALPAPRTGAENLAGAALPRDDREARLAAIWREVLGREGVGIHDNFFQLGGDSILSIQVVARARREGLLITARQLFEHQTIAGLAAVAGSAGTAAATDQGPIAGEAPLTPVQRLFLAEERREPGRFNQAVLLVPRARLAAAPLAAALDRLAAHHDALRLRFTRDEKGWRQLHAPVAPVPLLEVDLTAVPPAALAALEAAMERLQSGLALARGPLFTAALFRLGEAGDRLLLTAHHLVVDGVSWRVLLEDLAAALGGLELPAKTTSWKRWAELLDSFSRSSGIEAELPYWRASPQPPPLPRDLAGSAGTASVSAELGPEATRALLQEVPEVYRTQVNDLLLAALARAFAAWTGQGTLRVNLEGHGREEIFPGVDLSRTVGWFTTLFPVALALPPGGGPREAIRAVKETLRAVPRHGLGCGLLGDRLAGLPAPEVSFNYLGRLGRLDSAAGEGGPFAFAPEAPRGTVAGGPLGGPLFAIDALVLDGRLRVHWTYDPGRHLPATAERLARGFVAELAALVEHCRSPEAGGYTPSDFPLAGLDQAALDRLLGNDRGVEDLYPLAPMQEGMLFHSLYSAGADLYVEQLTAELAGPLDEPAFAAAWQRVVERHPALRAAFLWREVARPLQLVRREAALPWTFADWRGLPAGVRESRWRELVAADRARGFDLGRPPLLRLSLARLDDDTHRLVWSFHHLLFDGWCFPLLLADVFTLYREAHLPPAPRPFRDYVAWLAGRDAAAAEGFWRGRLGGFTVPTPLPFDHATGTDGSRADDYHERAVELPAPLTAALEALARRLRVTLNTVVQGAWALLLGRYAQVSDVVFGAVVSGRPAELPGVESMIGLFINTLPARVEIPQDEPTSAWLARLQESELAARQHDWLPLARVQALADVPPGGPLFASLLAFENYPVDPAAAERLGELRVIDVAVRERTNYPLTLTVVARGTLSLRLTALRRFEPATARRLLAHLENLLGALAAGPDRPPRALPLLAAAERHQLTVEWNDTAAALPDRSIPELFAEQAARRPDAPALLGPEPGAVVTYRELDARSAALAAELARQGVGRGDLVGLLAERSPELVIAILAVLRAGGAYVPLDPAYPRERLALLLADLGGPLVLVQAGLEDRLPEGAGQGRQGLQGLQEQEALSLPAVPAVPGRHLCGGDLAYVLYTSGSSGTPKGVAVPHRAVARLVRGTNYAAFGPDEVFLLLAPVSFDASTLELWGPLLNGGGLAIPPPGEVSPDGLERAIRDFGVTTLWLTAGLFHLVVDERLGALAPLRQLLAGGDVVSPAHAARVRRELPGLRLIDGYGPTENTTFTACGEVGEATPGASVSIGRPIAGTQVLVLDRELQPVPVGVPGELYAGGAGLALGYLGRPELTAAAFVPAPFGEPGERLYRTGDLVRRLPDGRLDFRGRADDQVKVRGFRVEPGEIEAALATYPGLRAAAVVVPPGGDALFACVVPVDAGNPPAAAELRAFLAARLPAYMVPSAWAEVPAFPLTHQGKVDRRALAVLATARPAGAGTPPSTPAERTMAGLWQQVLGVAEVRLEDDFFALGGQSLLATQLASRVRAAFGVEIPLRRLFEHPTLGDLTAVVMAEPGAAAVSPPLPPIPRRPPGLDAVPASFAQERLWFLERLRPGAAYNMFDALRAEGELSPALLAAVFGEIVRRHEALRTTFEERAGQPVQIVAAPGTWMLPLVDLTGLPAAARPSVARRLAQEEALRPFDLTRGPLLRALLLRLDARDHALLITLHHIVADGWSVGVFVREMTALYAAARAGVPSPLPALAVQYADFALWQREWLAGGELDRQLDYWRRRLAGAPAAIDLPTDRPRPAVRDPRGAQVPLAFDAATSEALSRLARGHGATLFMVLLAAFQTLLLRLTGQEDLPVGSGIANRNRAEIEPLIGFFVNALVLRNDLAGDPAFADLLARVRGTTLEAYAHQDLPFERLVEELRPERSLTANPLFQVSFVLQNAPAGAVELPGLTLAPFELAAGAARFDLELYAWQAGGTLAMSLYYATRLFDPATVQRLAGHLERLLAGIVADPAARLSALPLLAAAERHQLLREWNDTRVAAGGDFQGVAALVAGQARRQPEATALAFRGRRISYAGMDAQAGRLARRLAALGVGPEVMVGVHLERSPEMAIAALAVLQAGGAYVPLDPAQPDNRLAHIAAETRMPVVLTRERELAWAGAAVALRVDEPAPEPPPMPPPALHPESTAYVIYTSGSTGRPKGVPISQAGLLNMVRWEIGNYGFAPGVRMAQLMAPGFDAALGEIWPALAAGAGLHIADEETRLSPDALLAWLAAEGIDLCVLPTPMGELVLERAERGLPPGLALRALLVGGDRLKRFPSPSLPFPLVNNYGPTEAAMVASWAAVERAGGVGAEPWRLPAIGRPVANTRLHVVDRALRAVPVGVAGELAIGGAGLSPGYLGRPDLTAAAFVPDPFGDQPGERLYRTGDRVRRRPDGRLDFLERMDDQVKIRGYRIELGEIERVLERHPEVAEAAVVTRGEGEASGLRLAAYVVPAEAPRHDGGEALSHVAQWQELYDEAYGVAGAPEEAAAADPTFDIRGWNSTYTGGPIPAAEMREWVEGTAAQLLALRPRRVLEVGCGSGLLLYRVAPAADFYLGTDFSPRALEGIRRHLATPGHELPQVELRQALAHELEGIAPDGLDLVVLNSVVQYFPGVDYLVRVLIRAVRSVAPGGAVFVGDVRSLPLLPALAAAVELFQASDEMPVAELRRRIGRRLADEEELAIDPRLFLALARHLPAIGRVEIRLKRGRLPNELNRFRYDAVLHAGGAAAVGPAPVRTEAWESCAALERLLAGRPDALAVAGIPNARLAAAAATLALLGDEGIRTAGELRREAAARALPGVEPEALWELADRLGYEADLTGAATEAADGRCDAVFRRRGAGIPAGVAVAPLPGGEPPWSGWANDPLRAGRARRLPLELRRFLETELPDSMIPASFTVLDALPLTAHGKVDRAALPAPERVAPAGEWVAPATPLEELLARVAAEVLGVERVGLRDNFFALGGHSLLATQLVSRLTQGYGVPVTLQMMFDAADFGGLADHIVEAELAGADSAALDEALREMEGLSPAEIQELLGQPGLEEEAR